MTTRFSYLPIRFAILTIAIVALGLGFAHPATAQLPPEAVDLALVKIPQKLEAADICPVKLVPSSAEGETWSHEGVDYRGSEPGVMKAFQADPAKFANAHEKEVWVQNFMLAMSTIWCPITDEVTPGGRKQVDGLGYTWESCCSFCDEEMNPDNFTEALKILRERGEESFELAGGVYVNDASSPVEGAIKDDF